MKSPSTRRISWRCERRRRAARAAIVATALAVGCGGGVLQPRQGALDAARARWEANGPRVYTFEVQRTCFCPSEYVRRMRIEVTDGAVSTAVYVDDGEPVPARIEPPSIEMLFDEIQSAIDGGAHRLDASYDPTLGYPVDVSIDPIAEAVDEEQAFRVFGVDPAAGSAG